MKTRKNILKATLLGMTLLMLPINLKSIESLEVIIDEKAAALTLKVNAENKNEINFSIYNENERMIFSDRAEMNESFESLVDFSEYRQGTYKLVSTTGSFRYHKILEVKDSKVEIIDSFYSFTPVIQQDGDQLIVHYKNFANSDIGIGFTDESNNYFDFFYDAEGDMVFQKVFSLKNFESGEHTLTFTANGEFFEHVFVVL